MESQYLKDEVVILVHKHLAAKEPDYKEVARTPGTPGVDSTTECTCGIVFIPKFEELLFT
jgi:hypothetical protein